MDCQNKSKLGLVGNRTRKDPGPKFCVTRSNTAFSTFCSTNTLMAFLQGLPEGDLRAKFFTYNEERRAELVNTLLDSRRHPDHILETCTCEALALAVTARLPTWLQSFISFHQAPGHILASVASFAIDSSFPCAVPLFPNYYTTKDRDSFTAVPGTENVPFYLAQKGPTIFYNPEKVLFYFRKSEVPSRQNLGQRAAPVITKQLAQDHPYLVLVTTPLAEFFEQVLLVRSPRVPRFVAAVRTYRIPATDSPAKPWKRRKIKTQSGLQPSPGHLVILMEVFGSPPQYFDAMDNEDVKQAILFFKSDIYRLNRKALKGISAVLKDLFGHLSTIVSLTR
ncbi:hypothetical protein FB451DRAFT_39455 [Mycena latifolia]|nr:hypothetical protein FB451DRAFT_39455 [Mycena latifolia]